MLKRLEMLKRSVNLFTHNFCLLTIGAIININVTSTQVYSSRIFFSLLQTRGKYQPIYTFNKSFLILGCNNRLSKMHFPCIVSYEIVQSEVLTNEDVSYPISDTELRRW